MKRWVALLRGINVGGRNKMPMQALVALFEEMGCEEVRTYIQSGNVVFSADRLEVRDSAIRVAEAIRSRYGFEPAVVLLDAEQLAKAVAACPFTPEEGRHLHLYFLDSVPADPDLALLARLKNTSEELHLEGSFLYLLAPDGIGRSKLAAGVERAMGVGATARNWNTVTRLLQMSRE